MSTEQATRNEAADELRGWIEVLIADSTDPEQDTSLLDEALATERRNVVEQIAAGLGMFLYNRDFHMSHEESVYDARALIVRWLDSIATGTEED